MITEFEISLVKRLIRATAQVLDMLYGDIGRSNRQVRDICFYTLGK